jgi:hypothetical protein
MPLSRRERLTISRNFSVGGDDQDAEKTNSRFSFS